MCVDPITGFRTPEGKVSFDRKRAYYDRPVEVACGQCVECRLLRRSDWIVRNCNEAAYYEEVEKRGSCFITLTYDNAHLPTDMGLHVYDMKWFMYRLRTWLRRKKSIERVSYYYTGEYGTRSNRPHWHMLLFGFGFEDSRVIKGVSGDGHRSYLSDDLAALWPKGHSELGTVTVQSAGYCTGYISVNQKERDERFRRTQGDKEWYVRPEFSRMSLRPAIGRRWFDRYKDSVERLEAVYLEGKKFPIPKYYLNCFSDDVKEKLSGARVDLARESLKKGEVSGRNPERRKARAYRMSDALAGKSRVI